MPVTTIKLDDEWTRLFDQYLEQHSDPRNQACHRIAAAVMIASFPVGATIIGLPLAATMFLSGWGFLFLGHRFQGNEPLFFEDKRNMLVGALWWARNAGLVEVERA